MSAARPKVLFAFAQQARVGFILFMAFA